jgi:hypothetical protein
VALSLLDEGYSRNVYCALNLISTFYFFSDKIKEEEDKTIVKYDKKKYLGITI